MNDARPPRTPPREGPSSPPDGLAGQGAEGPPAREPERDGAAPRVKGVAGAGLRPPLTRLAAPKSMVNGRPRLRPVVQVRPAPGDNASTQAYRRRKRSFDDPAIDRRATQAGDLDDGRQSCEQTLRIVGLGRGEGGSALHHERIGFVR